MGHPRKQRKTYSGPSHPWQKERIEAEIILTREYGLKNKKELWKMSSLLSKIKSQTKTLSASTTEQSEKETKQLMDKLKSYGFVSDSATFDKVLSLEIKDFMDRRLQTILVTKKLARTIKQARQMIIHQHVMIDGKTISSPSYLVRVSEESAIGFNNQSSFKNESHPERILKKEMEEIKEEVRKIKDSKTNEEIKDEKEKKKEDVEVSNVSKEKKEEVVKK